MGRPVVLVTAAALLLLTEGLSMHLSNRVDITWVLVSDFNHGITRPFSSTRSSPP